MMIIIVIIIIVIIVVGIFFDLLHLVTVCGSFDELKDIYAIL